MDRIEQLAQEIRKNKELYYQGKPEISDDAFDKLEIELKVLSPNHPILNLVGTDPSGEKVKHDKKMLSLGKTYDINELVSWADKKEVIAVYKIDGVSCSLIYEDGKLIMAKTRGDGQFGENITNKVLWMKGVPHTIGIKDRIEVRGEMYCDESSFFHLSEAMEMLKLEKPSSQRNIVAGLVGRKENISLCKYLTFSGFDIIGVEVLKEKEKFALLKKNKFNTLEYQDANTQKEFSAIIEEAKVFMSEGDYQIDGLVFIYNDIKLHNELGETAHHPRYKMAFKFAGETKQTILNSITWQVSRNGILTPVGEVEPIAISDAVVSRVTLHNYGVVKQHNLKSGDKIEIIRSGEVIPKFLSVVSASNNDFEIPKECPSCEAQVIIEDIRLYCRNENCPAQLKESILNFIQKIGIDDLSGKRLDEVLKKKMISDAADLYDLSVEDFLTLDKIKEKLAQKFFDSIQKSKKTNLLKFLSSLGITGGAVNKCEKVIKAGHDTIEKILNLKIDDLILIDGFAEKSATEFVKSIRQKKKFIEKIISKGFIFEEIEKIDALNLPLSGQSICITGALSEKRSVIEAKIKALGASVVSAVSKNTTMLLTNEVEAKSSKYKKALELNIKIINEETLLKM